MADLRLLAADPAQIELFTMGYWLALLTLSISAAGMFVGMQTTVSGRLSVRFRPVWIIASAVAIGGVGVWLATVVSLLGISIPGQLLRYDVSNLVISLLVEIAAVYAGLMVAGREFQLRQAVLSTSIMGAGTAAMLWLQLSAIDVQGTVEVDFLLFAAAVLMAVALASASLYLFQRFRFPAARAGSVLLFAGGVRAFYHLGVSALEITLDPAAEQVQGQELFGFAFPMFVLGLLSLAVPITAVLVAPERQSTLLTTSEAARGSNNSGDSGGSGNSGDSGTSAGTPELRGPRPMAAAALGQRSHPLPAATS